MAAAASASGFVDNADFRQEKIIQKGPAIPLELSVTGEYGIKVQSVTLDKSEVSLTVGDKLKLTATVLPENASNKHVTWLSNMDSVATVDETGNVTTMAAGEAVISVYADNGNKSALCVLTITAAA